MPSPSFFKGLPEMLRATWPHLPIQVRVLASDGPEYIVACVLAVEPEHVLLLYYPDTKNEALSLEQAPWIKSERISAPGFMGRVALPAVAVPYPLIRQVRLVPGKCEDDPLGFRT